MFTKLISALKATRRTIVFTEGPDARILEAADRLIKDDLMDVILIGNVDEVKAAAAKGGFDIAKAEIIDPATYAGMDEMVAKMVELRKGKMSEEDCRAALAKGNYFGTMLVKMGKADALLGGASFQISGPTGAMSAVLVGIVAAHGLQGVFFACFAAGVLLLIAGVLRLGRLISFIPMPVIMGFTSGIAIIIALGQIDNFFGTCRRAARTLKSSRLTATLGSTRICRRCSLAFLWWR